MEDLEAFLRWVGQLRGGAFNLYKPVVRVEFFEHDEIWTIQVGRCKGMEEIVLTTTGSLHEAMQCAEAALESSGAK